MSRARFLPPFVETGAANERALAQQRRDRDRVPAVPQLDDHPRRGAAGPAKRSPARDCLAGPHLYAPEVGDHARPAPAVIDDYYVSVAPEAAGIDDAAGGRRDDRGICVGLEGQAAGVDPA